MAWCIQYIHKNSDDPYHVEHTDEHKEVDAPNLHVAHSSRPVKTNNTVDKKMAKQRGLVCVVLQFWISRFSCVHKAAAPPPGQCDDACSQAQCSDPSVQLLLHVVMDFAHIKSFQKRKLTLHNIVYTPRLRKYRLIFTEPIY